MTPSRDKDADVCGVQVANTRRTWFFRVWRLLVTCLVMVHLFPIRFGSLRALMVAGTIVVWFGALPLFWSRRWVRVTWAVATLGMAAMLLGPGRPDDPKALRNEYVASLKKYAGVRYIWGGENSRGIDCSGLIRVGLIDADVNRGIKTLNPALIREAVALWWFDCSADALKKEYRHNTVDLFDTRSLNGLDYSSILPGDFAVTESGVHTLAYIGDRGWIEAEPGPGRVLTIYAASKSIWFDQPMRIVRWRQLR